MVRWDFSPADLLDWSDADAELKVHPKQCLGDLEAHGHLLAMLLSVGISDSRRLLQEVPAALAAVRAGRLDCWVRDLADEGNTVAIRPDAAWVHYGHFRLGEDLRAFPLDGMEDVLRRWAEAVRHHNGDN